MKADSNTSNTPNQRHHKVNVIGWNNQIAEVTLTNREKIIFDLLISGVRSVTELTISTGFSDPRGYIRILRNKGINVADYWVDGKETRFKHYFIKQ